MTLRETFPLDPRKVMKKTISESIGYIWIIGFLAVMASAMAGSYLLLLVIPLVPIAVYLWQREYYKVYFYDMTEHGLEIKKGVFFPNSITIPAEKVSDVYVDQDLLDQFFGLYDLHFSSASQSSGNLSHIDGLGKGALDSLKSYLLSSLKSENAGPVGPKPSNLAQPGMGGQQGMEGSAAVQPGIIATFKPAPVGLWLDYAGLLIGFTLMSVFIFWPLLIGFPLVAIVLWVYNKKDFASRTYSLRPDGLWLKEGWINPKETMIFYKNVQDIDIVQGPFERLAGLYTLRVKSMSYLSAVASHLRLLSADDSKKVQELLRQQLESARLGNMPGQSGMQFSGTIDQEKGAGSTGGQAQGAGQSQGIPLMKSMASGSHPLIPGYDGGLLAKPFKNRFLAGNLASSAILIGMVFFATLCLVAASFIFSKALLIFAGIGSAICLLLAIFALITGYVDLATYSYSIGREGLAIELGLIARMKKVIRYEKIQDIQISTGFVESFLGLSTLYVETGSKDMIGSDSSKQQFATSATLTERIPYLSYADSKAMRSKLLGIIGLEYPKNQTSLRQEIPLSPSKPLKKTVAYAGMFALQLFISLLIIGAFTKGIAATVAFAGCALLFLYFLSAIIVYLYERVYMQKYFYDMNEDSLVIRKGVFGWSEIIVPFKNIQSIYVDQDWYDVGFDLWDVWITTVTQESGPMAHIDGVSREDAERLVKALAASVEKSRKN